MRGRRLPDAPPSTSRRSAWDVVDLAALHASSVGHPRQSVVELALVPVRRGRIPVGDARRVELLLGGSDRLNDEVAAALRQVLDRRFLIAWSAQAVIPFLTGIFGGGDEPWFRRTIDVHLLARVADPPADPPADTVPEAADLVAAARRHHVPAAPESDALDSALTTAQLFMVLATRFAERGCPHVGSLLQRTSRRSRVEGQRLVPDVRAGELSPLGSA